MKNSTFVLLSLATIAGVFAVTARAQTAATSAAQAWPSKPIRVITPVPAGGTPAQFGALVRSEVEKWRRIIRQAKIAPVAQ